MIMTLRRRFASALLATLVASASSSAQNQPPAELTLEQCIARALQKNFDLEAQRFSPQIAQDSIDVARDGYQPQLSVTSSRSGSSQSGLGTNASSTRVAVTQQLYSGTTFSVSSELNRSRLSPPVTVPNPAYNADLTVSVRQQLLKGFGTEVNQAAVNRAKIGYDKANLDYKVAVLNVIQNTENAFYNVVFAREQYDVRKSSLALAQRLYDEAESRRNVGVATDLDVLQASVGVATARRGVLLGAQAQKDSEQALLALIGQFELDAPLGPTHFKDIDEALPVFASSYQAAKMNQPDYLSAQAAIEQAKLDLIVAKNGARPSLSVGGAVGFNGHRGSGGDALSDAFDRENNSWQVDVALTYPWGQVGDRARYRQSLATLSQQQTRLHQLEQSIEAQVRSAVRAVETNLETVKIAVQGTELAVRQYELQKAKFDAGLATSRDVLQAQTDLETARVNELQSKVGLRTSISSLHRIEGSSLTRYAATAP